MGVVSGILIGDYSAFDAPGDDHLDSARAGSSAARSRGAGGDWIVNQWVKRGILLGFRLGATVDYSIDDNFRFFDKDTYSTKRVTINDGGQWTTHSSDASWRTATRPLPLWNTALYNDRSWSPAQSFGVLGATAPWDRRENVPAEQVSDGGSCDRGAWPKRIHRDPAA